MASPGTSILNGPPPSPANPPAGMAGLVPGPQTPPSGSPPPSADDPSKAIVAMGAEIDRALSALAQVSGGSPEFAEARRLIQAGIAKMLQGGAGGETAVSPTAAGAAFPGATPSSPVPRA